MSDIRRRWRRSPKLRNRAAACRDANSRHNGFQSFPFTLDLGLLSWLQARRSTMIDTDTRIERRPFDSLGHADHGWLNTRPHYSFSDNYDPDRLSWGEPKRTGGSPSWGAKPFPKGDRSGQFGTLASGCAEDSDALPIRADARVMAATVAAGETLTHTVGDDRHAYLVAATGAIEIDGERFDARAGAALSGGQTVTLTALGPR